MQSTNVSALRLKQDFTECLRAKAIDTLTRSASLLCNLVVTALGSKQGPVWGYIFFTLSLFQLHGSRNINKPLFYVSDILMFEQDYWPFITRGRQ